MIDVATQSDAGLKNLIENHRSKKATHLPLFKAALEEWHRRNGGELSLETSIAHLRAAAAERRFVSYGELAEANGATWDKVRYPMNAHLWALITYGDSQGWPMLSAMVVNKQHLATGAMEAETLAGFTKAATDLGLLVEDPEAFLRAQQEACFEWGAASPATDA